MQDAMIDAGIGGAGWAPMWDEREIITPIVAALRAREHAAARENAVRGLDALSEVELHPILAEGFEAAGLGVYREHPFPGRVGRLARRSERERCDLVLTPSPGSPPRDPMREAIEREDRAATLFHDAADPPGRGTAPEDCFWLEVKAVGQFAYVDGVPRANGAYASDLVRSIATDLRKLRAEARVRRGGVLLVLFTADEPTAAHDLPIALHRALDRNIAFRAPSVDGFEITDRIGNGWCCVAIVPVVPGGESD